MKEPFYVRYGADLLYDLVIAIRDDGTFEVASVLLFCHLGNLVIQHWKFYQNNLRIEGKWYLSRTIVSTPFSWELSDG